MGQVFQGTVQEKAQTRSGKAKIKVGGVWYFAGDYVNIDAMQIGMPVQIEAHTFKIGTMENWGLDAWNALPGAPTPPPPVYAPPGYAPANAPSNTQNFLAPQNLPPSYPLPLGTPQQTPVYAAPTPSVVSRPRPLGDSGDRLRFVSNMVGCAIESGKIEGPEGMKAWYDAAKALVMGKAGTGDDDFNDEIPF